MSLQFNENLNAISGSDDLEIQLLDGDLNIIAKLDDEPNDVGGLTSAELKAKFDEAGNTIQKYINETLIPAVVADDATEAARAAAEQGRVTAEEGRVTAEQGRVEAENARAAAETDRKAFDTQAEADEAARVTAEKGRVSAETGRASAEQSRASAEEQRATNEGNRQTSEQGRVEAEQARVTAEETRQTNETARQRGYTAMNQTVAKVGTDMAQFKVWETYSASKSYVPLNKVTYNGSSYICISAVEGVAPPNETYWQLIAAKGTDGEGAGDMLQADYDADGAVKDAGGIKAYADTKLPLAGGTMQGPVSMGGEKISNLPTPTANGDAVPKSYADAKLPKSGGTMTGAIDMGGKKLQNLPTPEADTDAAPKSYVDNGLKDRSKAVRGTYPAAAGQSIAVGDVVDVVNGEVIQKKQANAPVLVSNELGFNITDYCLLSNNRLAVAYWSDERTKLSIQLCALEDDRISLIGNPTVIAGTVTSYSPDQDSYGSTLLRITGNSFFLAYSFSGENGMKTCVFTVSGDSLVQGSVVESQIAGSHIYKAHQSFAVKNNTVVVFAHTNEYLAAIVYLVSGNVANEITSNLTLISESNYVLCPAQICKITDEQFFVATYSESQTSDNRYPLFTYIVTISNENSIAKEAFEPQYVDYQPYAGAVVAINGKYINICYATSSGNSKLIAFIHARQGGSLEVAGSTELLTLYAPGTNGQTMRAMTIGNGEKGLLLSAAGSGVVYSLELTINGNNVEVGNVLKGSSAATISAFCKMSMIETKAFVVNYAADSAVLSDTGSGWTNNITIISTQAIALTAASAGQNCDVLFAGVAETSGLTVGTNITSDGVQGYVPQTGVLSAFPWWDYQRVATVTGTYVGDGEKTRNIELGFQPKAVLLFHSSGITTNYYGGLMLLGFPVSLNDTFPLTSPAMEITSDGFVINASSNYVHANDNGNYFYYIAFR